jgi:hypothetical protein
MIIMFGFKYEHTPDSNSISIKLLGLKEEIEGEYNESKFFIENTSSLFQSKYSISIFNLPDSSEIDVKKRIDDFIKETGVEINYD